MAETLLITGGAGFVGSNLAIFFKQEFPSFKIVALDNLKRRGSEFNVKRLIDYGIEFIHGDIRNYEDLENIGKFDILIECSAEPSVLAGYNGSARYLINTNLFGTVNCLELVKKYKASIIFISTSRVYPYDLISNLKYIETETRYELSPENDLLGLSKNGISEQFPLKGLKTLYGVTKLSSEMLLLEYIDAYNIKGVINRCGVLTGPWQMGKVEQGFVSLWVAKHLFKGKLTYIGYGGKGKQVRDILHIKDLFEVIKIQINEIDKYNGEIYNIGGGKKISISLRELTDLCRKITGTEIPIKSIPETRKGDIPWYITDYSKFNKIAQWKPRFSVNKIVEDIYYWLKENEKLLKFIFS